jgi:hypothetical protein
MYRKVVSREKKKRINKSSSLTIPISYTSNIYLILNSSNLSRLVLYVCTRSYGAIEVEEIFTPIVLNYSTTQYDIIITNSSTSYDLNVYIIPLL